MYVSIDWFWLCFAFCLLSYLATLTILICPESPRWHLVNGRSVEAIIALNQIAQMNGSSASQGVTDNDNGVDGKGGGRDTENSIAPPPLIPLEAMFVEDPTNYDVTLDTKTRVAHHHASSVQEREQQEDDGREGQEQENMQLPPNKIDDEGEGAEGIDLRSADGN